MWNEQAGLVDDRVAVQNEVEIERARRTAVWARSPELLFDGKQALQQGVRRQRRRPDDGAVQHRRLDLCANVGSVVEGGNAQAANEVTQRVDGCVQRGPPVSDIAAECDGDVGVAGVYSIHRCGRTAPTRSAWLVRRPSRSS